MQLSDMSTSLGLLIILYLTIRFQKIVQFLFSVIILYLTCSNLESEDVLASVLISATVPFIYASNASAPYSYCYS